jgi:hypothetical protein
MRRRKLRHCTDWAHARAGMPAADAGTARAFAAIQGGAQVL